jgi:hypothetical protein
MRDSKGNIIRVPAVLGRAWTSHKGIYGIVAINHTKTEQAVSIRPPAGGGRKLSKIDFDAGNSAALTCETDGFYRVKIPAYTSAVLK